MKRGVLVTGSPVPPTVLQELWSSVEGLVEGLDLMWGHPPAGPSSFKSQVPSDCFLTQTLCPNLLPTREDLGGANCILIPGPHGVGQDPTATALLCGLAFLACPHGSTCGGHRHPAQCPIPTIFL